MRNDVMTSDTLVDRRVVEDLTRQLEAKDAEIAKLRDDLALASRGYEYAARYVLDRAEQYAPDSGSYDALRTVGCDILQGEARESARHGELDDPAMDRVVAGVRRAKKKKGAK